MPGKKVKVRWEGHCTA